MSTKLDAVKHILEAIGLDENAVAFLVTEQKINNFRRLVTMPEDTLKDLAESSLKLLTRADVNEIRNLAIWDKEFYRKNDRCPTVIEIMAISDTVWENFRSEEHLSDKKPEIKTESDTDFEQKPKTPAVEISTKTKFDIKAVPKHDGKRENWSKFDRLFTAVLGTSGLSDIVSTRYKVPDRESDDYKIFQEKNELVYNALQYATAEGQAFIKVKKFTVSKDGRGAYSYL